MPQGMQNKRSGVNPRTTVRGRGPALLRLPPRAWMKRLQPLTTTPHMPSPQLKLIAPQNSARQPAATPVLSADPVRRLFDYWCYMARKPAARTKLGPIRRQAITAALLLYSEDDLELAIEGNLLDDWCIQNARHDIDWLLQGESRIERFIDHADRIRLASAARDESPASRTDPAEALAAMQRNRARLDAVRGRTPR